MATDARSPASTPLDALARQAGGVFVHRNGRDVALHYGSAAGELAACVSAVGLADCSDLTKFVLEGEERHLRALVARIAGSAPAPGGALEAGGAWWCALNAERVFVICEAAIGERLWARMRMSVAPRGSVRSEDHSARLAALAVCGRMAPRLLAAVGAYGQAGDARLVPPFSAQQLAGSEVLWLLQSDRRALALMPAADAPVVWRELERAGRAHGICAVGREALIRYRLAIGSRPVS